MIKLNEQQLSDMELCAALSEQDKDCFGCSCNVCILDCNLSNTSKAAPELYAALKDMLSGWRYIRSEYGDLYGVGWERAQKKAEYAISKAEGKEVGK